MKLCILLEKKMKPVPLNIHITQIFTENLLIRQDNGQKGPIGDHVIVEGSPEAIRQWLLPYDGVWLSVGDSLIQQQFEVAHIRD